MSAPSSHPALRAVLRAALVFVLFNLACGLIFGPLGAVGYGTGSWDWGPLPRSLLSTYALILSDAALTLAAGATVLLLSGVGFVIIAAAGVLLVFVGRAAVPPWAGTLGILALLVCTEGVGVFVVAAIDG